MLSASMTPLASGARAVQHIVQQPLTASKAIPALPVCKCAKYTVPVV